MIEPKQLGITASIPEVFEGIPVLNNQNATFYYFIGERGDHDIDDLWDLFENALRYSKSKNDDDLMTVSSSFDLVVQKKGNGNSKITMALYWIAPESFLNLDSRNIWYIYESGDLPEPLVKSLPVINPKVSASVYFEVVTKLRSFLLSGQTKLKDFKDLSFEAWNRSQEVNSIAKEKKKKLESEWYPSIYNPSISVEQWAELLADKTVFTDESLEIMKRIKEYGGQATCTQLSVKYGETPNFYNTGVLRVAVLR